MPSPKAPTAWPGRASGCKLPVGGFRHGWWCCPNIDNPATLQALPEKPVHIPVLDNVAAAPFARLEEYLAIAAHHHDHPFVGL